MRIGTHGDAYVYARHACIPRRGHQNVKTNTNLISCAELLKENKISHYSAVCQGDGIDERRGTAVCVGEDKVTVGKMLVVESTWPLELC